jgi:preprotein translocase subunit YajC
MTNLMNLLIAPAYADTPASAATAAVQSGSSPISLTLMFVIFFLFFYFVMWRPQSKRAKEHRDLMSSLAKGDEVVTAGGLLGKISKVTDQYIVLSIGHNAEVMVQRSAITNALPRGTLKSLES